MRRIVAAVECESICKLPAQRVHAILNRGLDQLRHARAESRLRAAALNHVSREPANVDGPVALLAAHHPMPAAPARCDNWCNCCDCEEKG